MEPASSEDGTPLPPAARQGRVGLWTVLSVFVLFGLAVLAGLSLTGRTLVVPDLLRAEVEKRLNLGLEQGAVQLGRIELAVGGNGRTELVVRNVSVSDPSGAKLADLNVLRSTVQLRALLRGEVVPTAIVLSGAQITVRRDVNGEFTLAYGGGVERAARDAAQIFDGLEETLAVPALAGIEAIAAEALVVTLEDARTGRLWQASNASARLTRTDDGLSMTIVSEIFNGTEDLARVQLSARSHNGSSRVELGAAVAGVAASDVAVQAPALSYFALLDAPLSGSIRSQLDDAGALEGVAATLDIGAGSLKPSADAPDVPFDGGRAYFTFDPGTQRFDFSDLSVNSKTLALSADGQAWLGEFRGDWPSTMTGQLTLREVRLAPEGVFGAPVALSDGNADFRVRLDPFSVELGRFSAGLGEARFTASAQADIVGDDWNVALDAGIDRIGHDDVLRYWPQNVTPGTRAWLRDNVSGGTLTDVRAALRVANGGEPVAGLSYDYADATVRYLPEMAPLTRASGRTSLHDHRFVITLDEGIVDGPAGPVDVSDTVFTVTDVRDTPSTVELDLRTRGSLPAAMTILSAPPLELLEDTEITPDTFAGSADLTTRLSFQTVKDLRIRDIELSGSGTISGVESSTLVEGRDLQAETLSIAFDDGSVTVEGALTLDGIPADARWSRALGPDAPPGGGNVVAQTELSQSTLAALGIDTFGTTVRGASPAQVEIELPEEAPPVARIASSLGGLGLAIPAIGWTKSDPLGGALAATVELGPQPNVTELSLSAPGLRAENIDIRLGDDGRFQGLRVPELRVGDWLEASVSVISRGDGAPPGIRVDGGAIDIRELDIGSPSRRGGDGRRGDRGPVRLEPNQVIVTDGIVLSDFVGQIDGNRGTFRARINGGTPIRGNVWEVSNGTAIRIRSEDAGGVIRDAGFLRNGAGGAFDLLLTPTGRPGTFGGELLIEDVLVRDAPALAALLDAVSIVGLLDDGGAGIWFDTVDAQFRLSPNGVQLLRSAAVGASMGISMDGVYDTRTKRMDMQGVVSPLYMINGVGSMLTRRGEGLFGFAFRMTGQGASPRISINPLSFLTPGMFREIFRRPPPRVDGVAPGQ